MVWVPKAQIALANDLVTASLVLDPTSQARAAIQAIADALISAALAADPTLASQVTAVALSAVQDAVDAQDIPGVAQEAAADYISEQGVLVGRLVADVGGRVWGHAARDQNGALRAMGLGYDNRGHLDQVAVDTFREDLVDRVIVTIPGYAWVRVTPTPDGYRVLDAEKLNGDRVIPGLQRPDAWNEGGESDSSRLQLDYPGASGGLVRQYRPRPGVGFILGSSTGMALAPRFSTAMAAEGWDFTDLSKNGELGQHAAARFGSLLVHITGSGPVPTSSPGLPITTPDMPASSSLLAYEVTLAGRAGTFRIEWNATAETFALVQLTGPAALLTAGTPVLATPTLGPQFRDATGVFNLAKSNLWSTAGEALARTLVTQTLRFLTPAVKQFVVINHFANSVGTTAAHVAAVNAHNAWLAEQVGAAVCDMNGFLLGPDVWSLTGITKTAADQDAIDAGLIAPSLTPDGAHMSGTVRNAFVDNVLIPHVLAPAWKAAA